MRRYVSRFDAHFLTAEAGQDAASKVQTPSALERATQSSSIVALPQQTASVLGHQRRGALNGALLVDRNIRLCSDTPSFASAASAARIYSAAPAPAAHFGQQRVVHAPTAPGNVTGLATDHDLRTSRTLEMRRHFLLVVGSLTLPFSSAGRL